MKKLCTISISLMVNFSLLAQWDGTSLDGNTYRNGNVGIGVLNPVQKLQVQGVANLISPHDGNNFLHFDYASNGNKVRSYGTNLFLETRNNTEDIEFRTDNSVTPLMIVKGNGNVGIGVLNPVQKLQVQGVADLISPHDGNNFLHFDYASNGNKVRSYGTNLFLETRNNTEDIEFRTDNSVTSLMIIKGNGNVGIGTTDTKGAKLAVGGKIYAEECKIWMEANWVPDYVFSKNYNLRTLEETESYIKENSHLPGIPSAKEVEENEGIDIGKMNMKLLEKVEELTLYLIEQNKELKSQKYQNLTQQAKIEQLEKKISRLENE